MGLVMQARGSMQALVRLTGLAVELGVLDGPEVLLVERVEGRLRSGVPGSVSGGEVRLPAYCTALGKLLLAMVRPDVGRELLREVVLERRTPTTVRSKGALREKLWGVCESGVAVCDGELMSDVVMIAAAVRDVHGEVQAALGLSAMKSRITAESLASALGPHLLSSASQISARLGYRRADERARVAS